MHSDKLLTRTSIIEKHTQNKTKKPKSKNDTIAILIMQLWPNKLKNKNIIRNTIYVIEHIFLVTCGHSNLITIKNNKKKEKKKIFNCNWEL